MKKHISFLIAFLSAFLGFAQAPDSLTAANGFYQAEQYESAIRSYESIVEKGYSSEALFYNLGNAYYKNGQIARSILNYERALLLDPNDEDVIQNLSIANLSTVDRFEKLPQPLIRAAYQGFFKALTPANWSVVALLFLLFSLGAAYVYFFTSKRRLGFTAALVSFLLFGLSLAMAYQHQSYRENNQAAIVLNASVYAKSGPSAKAEDVFILHEGTKLLVIETFEDWKKTRLPDGKIGWLPMGSIEQVDLD
jgi:tetratricopeptide (TPR) repeat protein